MTTEQSISEKEKKETRELLPFWARELLAMKEKADKEREFMSAR